MDIPDDVMDAATKMHLEHLGKSHQSLIMAIARAIMAERERFGWHPVETAPKDGREFVASWGHQGGVQMLVNYSRVWKTWMSKGEPINGFEANATHWFLVPNPPKVKNPNKKASVIRNGAKP